MSPSSIHTTVPSIVVAPAGAAASTVAATSQGGESGRHMHATLAAVATAVNAANSIRPRLVMQTAQRDLSLPGASPLPP